MHKPTESELLILHHLWENGPSTVREVNDSLNDLSPEQRGGKDGEIGYTTTLKIMQIMFEKGLVDRIEDGRTHRYSPLIQEQDTKNLLLNNFLETTFRGSAMDMVMQALGGGHTSDDDLEKIKALIADMEQKQGKN